MSTTELVKLSAAEMAAKIKAKDYFHKRLQFHKIDSYLKKDTEIEYRGDYLTILYKAGGLITDGITNYISLSQTPTGTKPVGR